MIVLDYALREAISGEELRIQLTKRQNRGKVPNIVTGFDFADDITLLLLSELCQT